MIFYLRTQSGENIIDTEMEKISFQNFMLKLVVLTRLNI